MVEPATFTLASEAFALTARYDAAIATGSPTAHPDVSEPFPSRRLPADARPAPREELTSLRRDPAPARALYASRAARRSPPPRELHGKELSYNNLLDLDAASASRDFEGRPCVIVKHNNPCGAALAERAPPAYRNRPSPAIRCPPSAGWSGSTG